MSQRKPLRANDSHLGDLEDLEPRLTRHGYSVRTLADQLGSKPAAIREFLRGELNAARSQELSQRMKAAGLPI